ncbi:MAG: hypothetical protein APF76_03615 [Desulfitibacter sp. BRH_c19]|nr:MAG: hypothetical protein APF76_03615 [Desulfitibacter sp. BRH_c19]
MKFKAVELEEAQDIFFDDKTAIADKILDAFQEIDLIKKHSTQVFKGASKLRKRTMDCKANR